MNYIRKYADLHVHSNYSDGTYSAEEIFRYAKKKNLSTISITDHDNLNVYNDAVYWSEKIGIEYIPGIEFSVEWPHQLHILAFYIDVKNENLNKLLNFNIEQRNNRSVKIINQLKDSGLDVDFEEFSSSIKIKVPGRPHVAQYLIKKKIVKTFDEAFDKYLTPNKPGYVSKTKFDVHKVINIIKEAKGIPVIAHPKSLKNDMDIPKLVELGIKGLEVFYSDHTPTDEQYYLKLAQKYNLCVTGGSDCHGKAKKEILMGKVKLPYKYIENLKTAKKELYE